MLLELGVRSLGKCDLKLSTCNCKNFGIVKKIIYMQDSKTGWACQKCIVKRLEANKRDVLLERSYSSVSK